MNVEDVPPVEGYRLPEALPLATATVDERGVVIEWSQAAERLLGLPAGDILGRSAAELLVEPEEQVAAVVEQCRAGGRCGMTVVRHRDGRRLRLALQRSPAMDRYGNTNWSLTAVPLGQDRGAEASRLTFASFLAHSSVGAAVLDTDLRYVWVNDAMERVALVPAGRRAGGGTADVCPGDGEESAEAEAVMHRVLETGVPVTDYEFRARNPKEPAQEHVYRASFSRLEEATGRVLGVWYTVTDITRSRRERERLTLLSEAGARSAALLDTHGAAGVLADLVVPRFADFVSVDVFDWVLHGEEPAPDKAGSGITLRRVAQRSVEGAQARGGEGDDDAVHHSALSPETRALLERRSCVWPPLGGTAATPHTGEGPDWNEQARELGIHARLVTPLCTRGVILGIATFARFRHEDPFEADDVPFAEELVAHTAVCMDNARRLARERNISLTLQRSLLPRSHPEHSALEVASHYWPADSLCGVGGDWFDVIRLSGSRVALVVGDVVGHGVNAAAAMAKLRTAVETLAAIEIPPDELLARLDDLVINCVEREEGASQAAGSRSGPATVVTTTVTGATCLYVVYDPVTGRCTFARAGHPPPLIVGPEGRVRLADLPAGPPLGLGALPYESIEIELPENSLVALYTDGLIEGRDLDIDAGLSRLSRILARPGAELDDLCREVTDAVLPRPQTDDAALLLARTHVLGEDQVASWELSADPAAVSTARDLVGRRLQEWKLDELSYTTELLISELVTNAIRYGKPPIQMRLIRDDVLICDVADASSSTPRLRHARTTEEGGRGLFIIAQIAPRWGTRYTGTGKIVWVEQNLPTDGLS